MGWQAAALKLAARDRWIGWSPQQRRRRLHLVLQNSRFVILPPWQGRANLASRVLGLSLRRLSDDMLAEHGFPILLAESFVDPQRFAGTCYRAANWRWLGQTGGYARLPGATPQWRRHGQPKEVFVYEVQPQAARQLAQPADDPAWDGPARSQPVRAAPFYGPNRTLIPKQANALASQTEACMIAQNTSGRFAVALFHPSGMAACCHGGLERNVLVPRPVCVCSWDGLVFAIWDNG